MKTRSAVLPVLSLAALLLASCAPTTLGGTAGRIVDVRSGQEGSVRFLGGVPGRPPPPGDPDKVAVNIGGVAYSGRATVIGEASGPHPGGAGLGLSLGFGSSFGPGGGSSGGFAGVVGSSPAHGVSTVRQGNLIAKATARPDGSVPVLSCTFQVDAADHGIGSCQDSAGASYTLQF
ncbi:MAG: hypothetical protein ACR2J4_02235 [Deinococcus sp.]